MKRPIIDREPKREFKMKARPNWDDLDDTPTDSVDRLHIPEDLKPDGLAFQWVTDSVFGQPVGQHRSQFERRGWTPVHQEDFDGVFDGMFMPKGARGEISVEGLVLMARPKEFSEKARDQDRRRAREQVFIKEQSWKGGDLSSVTLDAAHPTAVRTNKIGKSMERIAVPEDR